MSPVTEDIRVAKNVVSGNEHGSTSNKIADLTSSRKDNREKKVQIKLRLMTRDNALFRREARRAKTSPSILLSRLLHGDICFSVANKKNVDTMLAKVSILAFQLDVLPSRIDIAYHQIVETISYMGKKLSELRTDPLVAKELQSIAVYLENCLTHLKSSRNPIKTATEGIGDLVAALTEQLAREKNDS